MEKESLYVDTNIIIDTNSISITCFSDVLTYNKLVPIIRVIFEYRTVSTSSTPQVLTESSLPSV